MRLEGDNPAICLVFVNPEWVAATKFFCWKTLHSVVSSLPALFQRLRVWFPSTFFISLTIEMSFEIWIHRKVISVIFDSDLNRGVRKV